MVFLGGAVLANIVSRNSPLPLYINSQCADGGQGGHVDIKGGVAGAGLASTREAGRPISLTRNLSNPSTSITIELWHSKAILPNPLPVSLAKSVSFLSFQGCWCYGMDTRRSSMRCISTSNTQLCPVYTFLRARPEANSVCGLQPHGRSTYVVEQDLFSILHTRFQDAKLLFESQLHVSSFSVRLPRIAICHQQR
jgi:hypothetical protein